MASSQDIRAGRATYLREEGTLSFDDGEVTVAPRRVVYYKRFARESRVGFGQQ